MKNQDQEINIQKIESRKRLKKEVNLFNDKRGDWDYGYVQFASDSYHKERRIEIRRKPNASIYDEAFMLIDGEWLSMDDIPEESYVDMPTDKILLIIAVCSSVSSALDMADGWRTHNANQKMANRLK